MSVPGSTPEDWLVAHRGYPWRYPENSLAGMRAVLEAGARLVECDVQMTADGHAVVSHDDRLQRVAGVPTRVTATSRAELEGISVGERARFGDAFRDARIPALAEMLALVDAYPDTGVFVDVKGASVTAFGDRAIADAALAALASLRSECVVLCGHVGVLARIRASGVRVGWVVDAWAADTLEQTRLLAPDFLFSAYAQVRQQEPPALAVAGGPRLAVYGVNDAATALALRARGHLIETDGLPELAAACRAAEGR